MLIFTLIFFVCFFVFVFLFFFRHLNLSRTLQYNNTIQRQISQWLFLLSIHKFTLYINTNRSLNKKKFSPHRPGCNRGWMHEILNSGDCTGITKSCVVEKVFLKYLVLIKYYELHFSKENLLYWSLELKRLSKFV